MGRALGSIIATIITSQARRNMAADTVQVQPGMGIHIMDIVQPPGMSMPPAMEPQKWTVPATAAANRMAHPQINSKGSYGNRGCMWPELAEVF
jgi:hypothetical protein